MTCLAFDQSTDWTGVAVVRGSAVGHRGVVDGATIRSRDYREFRDGLQIADALFAQEPTVIAYEAAYVHPYKRPEAAFNIMRAAGWIEALLSEALSEMPFLSATARVWRNTVWRPGAGSWPRKQADDYALLCAQASGLENPTEHLGNAIGIGNWAITEFLGRD